MKIGIVLSGGGSKGAYQIGVWKALRRLNIKYNIVTGTSIGAINGLMMVQNDFNKAINLWQNIGYNELFDEKFDNVKTELEVYKKFAEQFIKNGGMSSKKIHDLIIKSYNAKKFYKSKIDYGIVTYSLSKMKPKVFLKKDSPEKLVDYVMASSACFPAFQSIKIENDNYIDGGYYDNLPINLALELGAEEIIAIDLRAVGLKKQVSNKDVKIISITPRNAIGSFLVFDKNLSRRAINYGYNDTMKTFCKLDGTKYTFKKGNLIANYRRIKDNYVNQIENVLTDYKDEASLLNKIIDLEKITNLYMIRDNKQIENSINDTLEYAGKLLNLDDSKIYNITNYNKELKLAILSHEAFSKKYISKLIKESNFKKMLNRASIVRYIYNAIIDLNGRQGDIYLLASLFPKEFLVAIYISVV